VDETKILKETVLDPIGEGFKTIVCGMSFIVQKHNGYTLLGQFDYSDITNDLTVICDVPTHLVVVGDKVLFSDPRQGEYVRVMVHLVPKTPIRLALTLYHGES
jgi:hypothetical protein